MSRQSRKSEMRERDMLEEVTPTEALEILHDHGENYNLRPVVLVGPVGMGKTSVAKQYAKERAERAGFDTVIDTRISKPQKGEASVSFLNLNDMEPEDLMYPSYGKNKYTTYERVASTSLPGADPSWGPHESILNTMILEEIGKKREMMPFTAQLLCERSVGTSYLMPPQVHVVCTANGASHNANSYSFTADVMDRATFIKVWTPAKAWLKHMEGRLHPLIIATVGVLEDDFLNTFEREPRGEQFATPRSMEAVSDMLIKGLDLDSRIGKAQLFGNIGQTSGRELLAVHNTMQKMHDLDAMIADPNGMSDKIQDYKEDTSNNGKIALAGMVAILSKRVRKDASEVNKLLPFVKLFGEELEVTFAHMALTVNKKVQKEKAFVDHMVRLQETHYF